MTEETYQTRLSICEECDERTFEYMCKACMCYIPSKVKTQGSSCPLGKWEAM